MSYTNNKKYYFLGTTIFILFSIIYLSGISLDGLKNLAGVFFINSTTKKSLDNDYLTAEKGGAKVKILIVPGHYGAIHGGTEFRGVKERDLNIKMAESLAQLFGKNKNFKVFIARDENGYNKNIQKYIQTNYKAIKAFRKGNKETMDSLVSSGLIDIRNKVEHNSAPSATVIRLYGINKWADENDIDIVIHAHLNDYPNRKYNRPGKYSGTAIYIPEKQFSNAQASLALAKNVLKRISKYSAISNLPLERGGIIGDQELIAIGAYNTLNPAVMLIEYGYIYEAKFMSPNVRMPAIKELAMQTYLGVLDFFGAKKIEKDSLDNTSTLPYTWKNNLKKGMRGSKDIFALQTALAFQSLYPPAYKNENNCPINGNFGPCTDRAIINFQKKYNIKPAYGFVGPLTRFELNKLYSIQK